MARRTAAAPEVVGRRNESRAEVVVPDAVHCDAGEERVLVWDPALAVPSAVLLALCAWPEHPAVSVRIEGDLQALCAIYQREPALACALELIDAGETGPSGLLAELDASVIEGDDLAPLLE